MTDSATADAGVFPIDTDSAVDADRRPFSFTGSGGEYFRIWIVNILLTILTLYVYSAWAKVRTRRYFHGNTVLDGSAFEYHARPLQILAGRVIAVLLLIAVTFGSALHPLVAGVASFLLFALLPWAIWRSTIFNARMTSYRNVRFDFRGGLGKMVLYLLALPTLQLVLAIAVGVAAMEMGAASSPQAFVGVVALGALVFFSLSPWVHRNLAAYFATHHRYGSAPFVSTPSTGRFYAIYGQAFLLVLLVTFLMVGAAVGAAALSGVTVESLSPVLDELEEDGEALAGLAIVLFYPLFFLVAYFVRAFFRARVRNHLFARTVVDGRVRLESTVRTWPLWRLLVGNLLLLVVTLGLAWPWIQVRKARFFANNTAVLAPNGLHAVVDALRERQSALGEELGDAFDMDMDVGF